MNPLRSALLFVSFLLLPLAFTPVAEAGEWCGRYTCCWYPDPSGQPGSVMWLVTSTAGSTMLNACIASEEVPQDVLRAVDCILNGC